MSSNLHPQAANPKSRSPYFSYKGVQIFSYLFDLHVVDLSRLTMLIAEFSNGIDPVRWS